MFSSPEPTPEQSALHGLKMRCFDSIHPYRNRIAHKEYAAFCIKLKYCETTADVLKLYDKYRGILEFRKIASLPELPGQQKQMAA